MADGESQESRTEEPTEKKISEAVEKGNVPFSRDAVLFGSLASILAGLLLIGRWSVLHLTETLQVMFDHSGLLRLDDREAATSLLTAILFAAGAAILPLMALIAGGTITASLLQNAPSAATERIRPKLNRISIRSGWSRLFGPNGWVEFAKSFLKLLAVVAVIALVLRSELPAFVDTLSAHPVMLPSALLEMAALGLLAFTLLSLMLATADLALVRIKWRRELRMTRNELKEEMKQAEGDPLMKARIRSIARQRSSRRMLKKLPQASMVIVNPAHYAVALRYAPKEDGAPVVVAKGVDFMAAKIREIATEHEVPLVENKPLARALYDKVDLDAQIPAEFYRAVAEIIHFLSSRRRLPRR